MSRAQRALLPNEPQGSLSPSQVALTERYLAPCLAELEAFLLALRAAVDPVLEAAMPVKLGKRYPLGQCLEISEAVQEKLRRPAPAGLGPAARAGHDAYAAFRRAGGSLRQVWGDLRGEFFQNAFQMGALYVDVSNDTVTITKPKVEILPFSAARFTPVGDFRHFVRIAERYWQNRFVPNHILPDIAPFCPLIRVTPAGAIQLSDPSQYMLALAQAGGFHPSAEVLADAAMPEEIFEQARQALAASPARIANNPLEGRAQALETCRLHRARRWHLLPDKREAALAEAVALNRLLAGAPRPSQPGPDMTTPQTITVDGVEFRTSELSKDAREQLDMLLATDARLKELQRDLAITQTARNAYLGALKALLPDPAGAASRLNH